MRPLKIGRDGLVEFATPREIDHLTHCLEQHPEPTTKSRLGIIESVDLIAVSTPSSETTVECPACGFKGTSYEITRHVALSHARAAKRKEFSTLLRSLKSQGTKVCPLCHVPVRAGKLQKHMSDRCPIRNRTSQFARQPQRLIEQVKQPKRSRTSFPAQSVRRKGEIEVEQPSWRNNLDATKDCGYPAREEGRYGSYPSHDGFDDESKP